MKKMLMCCGALCLTLALFCGTALALDVQVTPVNAENAKVEKTAKGDDVAFTVTKSDAGNDKLYLIMIQEGTDANATPKPDKDNLYYLNVEEGSKFPLEAYPKDLKADSSYVVYLSDYSADNNGAAKGIAVISTKAATTPGGDTGDSNTNPGGDTGDSNANPGGDTGDSNTNPGGDTGDSNTNPGGDSGLKLGDVNNDTYIDGSDAYLVMRIFAGLPNGDKAWTDAELAAANVNKDDYVDGSDALLIMQNFAGLLDDNFQRK